MEPTISTYLFCAQTHLNGAEDEEEKKDYGVVKEQIKTIQR